MKRAFEGAVELLEELALLGGELGRDDDVNGDDLVASVAAAQVGDALAAHPELLIRLRAGR